MSSPPRPILRLSEISGLYDVLFCDVWGVIHNGREAFPEACDALSRFAEQGCVVLVSNAPRPASDVVGQLDGLGVPRRAWTRFVTSGDATRALLAERAPGPAWAIGPERDATLYAGLPLAFSSPETARFISCTGPEDDERETPEDYRSRLAACASRGIEMICANPDIVVQRGDRLIYCGGALAQLYGTLGGPVVMAGKPHPPIYRLAFEAAGAALGRPAEPSRTLCVGDGVGTDVRGAMREGLDCLFIAGGVHGRAALDASGRFDVQLAAGLLAVEAAQARFAAPALVW